ncbi:MAG: hypothetical protein ACRD2N_01040 [Vicinamibacterales bacterium]
MRCFTAAMIAAACSGVVACGGYKDSGTTPSAGPRFFVTSSTSTTGNLGGLAGADARCQSLAAGVGLGGKTWRAYLSAERDTSGARVDARSRIGQGPWTNVNGVTVANNLNELHSRRGDAAAFIDERGQRINGQWTGSPGPNQHDILTGSNADGTVMVGFTCADWTSDSASLAAQVGHSDGFGGNQDTSGTLTSWNSAHANQNCSNTAPRGGAGKIYCFATN